MTHVGGTKDISGNDELKPSVLTLPQPMYRKELCISGQIGDANHKDKLTLSSLNHPIETAKSKGYSEMEIVEAVLKAMHPSLKLRSNLKGRTQSKVLSRGSTNFQNGQL